MFGVACGALVLAACAGSPTTTVTVTETATAPAAQSEVAAPTEEAESVAPAPEPDVIVVADMVGQNYQDAQDVWRASGLVVIPAEDATGANRLRSSSRSADEGNPSTSLIAAAVQNSSQTGWSKCRIMYF